MNLTNIKNYFTYIIILVLIIVICLQRCGNGKVQPQIHDTVTTTSISYKTITKEIPTYVPKYVLKTKYIHDTTTKIDTIKVIDDYYSTYEYKDSIKIKDTLNVQIIDRISENKIKSRDVKYKFILPTIIKDNTTNISKNEFYIGLGLIGSKNGIGFFGPELLLRTKNKNVYGIGAGIDGSIQPQLSLRSYWKIGKK